MLNPIALCSAPPLLRAIATTDACSVTKGPKKMKRKKAEDEDDGNDSDGDGAGASTAPKSQKHKKTKVPLHSLLATRSLATRPPRHSLQHLPCPAVLMAAPGSFAHSRLVAGDFC